MTSPYSVEFSPVGWQKEFLAHLLSEAHEHLALNNVCTAYRLRGNLDLERLKLSFCNVVARHESLRTLVLPSDEPRSAVYKVLKDNNPVFEIVDFVPENDTAAADPKAFAAKIAWVSYGRHDFPARIHVIRSPGDDYIVVLSTNHLTTDVVSHSIIWRELSAAYAAEGILNDAPPVQYREFVKERAEWENGWRQSKDREYWENQIGNDLSRNYKFTIGGNDRASALDIPILFFKNEDMLGLNRIAQRIGATNFTALLTLFVTCLAESATGNSICFALLADERGKQRYSSVIGNFPQIRPFQVNIGGQPTFADLAARVRMRWLEVFQFPWIPEEVQHVFRERYPPNDWFDVFDYMKMGIVRHERQQADGNAADGKLFECDAEWLWMEPPLSDYRRPTAFLFSETDNQIFCRALSANPNLYPSLGKMLHRMRALIPIIEKNPEVSLVELWAKTADTSSEHVDTHDMTTLTYERL